MALYITIILYNFSFVKEFSKLEPLNKEPRRTVRYLGLRWAHFALKSHAPKNRAKNTKSADLCAFFGVLQGKTES